MTPMVATQNLLATWSSMASRGARSSSRSTWPAPCAAIRRPTLTLQPFDVLSVKEVSLWQAQESVTLKGEVRFPGNYAIQRGETLKSVIERAGGLTEYAFPEGSVFTREELRRREQEQLDMLANRMQTDLTVLALQERRESGSGGATSLSLGQACSRNCVAPGQWAASVIDLPRLMREPDGLARRTSSCARAIS